MQEGLKDEKLKEALIMLSPLGPLYTISKLMREGKLPPLPVPLPVARSQLEQASCSSQQQRELLSRQKLQKSLRNC